MGRLVKAILLTAAATGTAYLIMRALQAPVEPARRRREGQLLDEDELSEVEKERLLRELSSLL